MNKKLVFMLTAMLWCMLAAFALAEEALPEPNEGLPQMVKVEFPAIDYTAPVKPTDNFKPSEAAFNEDSSHYHDDTLDV